VAFESIGGEMTGNIFNALEEEGTLYHYGNLSLRNCSNISTGDLIFLDKKIRGFWLFKYLNDTKDNDVMSNFFLYLESEPQLFDTSIQGVFKPHQFEDAFQLYRKEMSRGKVLFDFNFNFIN
jgi:NADPH:quinone reductase